jgi:hypothetical protein
VHTAIAEATVPTLTSGADISLTWSQRLQRGTAMARRRNELAARTLLRTAFTALQQATAQQRLADQFVARHRGASLFRALSNWRTTVVRSAAVRAAGVKALRRRAVRSLTQWHAAAVCERAVSVRSRLQLRKAARHCVAHWQQWARTAAQARALCRRLHARRAQRTALQHWRATAAAATAIRSATSMQLSAPLRAVEAVIARAARRALAGRCFAVWRVQVIEVGRALQCRSRAVWGLRMWRRRSEVQHFSTTLILFLLLLLDEAAASGILQRRSTHNNVLLQCARSTGMLASSLERTLQAVSAVYFCTAVVHQHSTDFVLYCIRMMCHVVVHAQSCCAQG